MSIASRAPSRLRCERRARASPCVAVLLLALLSTFVVHAHPVAQGALLATVETNTLRVRATISTEEVLVGSLNLGHADQPESVRLSRYGEYLLEHVHIDADGRRLEGRLARVPRELHEPLEFELEYPFGETRPHKLEFSQNALRGFLYAPGNPWEARYLLKVGADAPSASTVLLTSENTAAVNCDWKPSGVCAIDRNERNLGVALVLEGIRHILTGYDHILFVAALLLAVDSLWDLIKVISVFTLAHTLTLTLATFGILRLTPLQIEPVIAASIVAVAAQNLFWPRQSRGAARLATAFVFGLFHGLGFAGGLVDAMAALSIANTLWALAAFSLGVEIGQQIVVVPLFAALYLCRRHGNPALVNTVALRGGSLVIGVAGLCYLALALRTE